MDSVSTSHSASSLRAAIQIRVSSEDQTRGHSLETQREESINFRRSHGWSEGRIYEEVESAWKKDTVRAQYHQLIEDAEAGRFQVLIVWKIDRFTRNTAEGWRILEHLIDDLKIEFHSVTEPVDTKTAYGRKRLRDAISEAEFESERLRERLMPGMKRGVRKGHWQGSRYCFYGYHYDKPNKRLVEIAEEIRVLRIIYDLRAERLAIYSIALRLAELGIRNRKGRLFTTHQIDLMLRRSFYVDGYLVWGGERSDKPVVTPAIPRDIWEKVQEVNQARSYESTGVRPGRATSSYILQRVLRCRVCKGYMVGQRLTTNRRTGTKAPWYACGQRLARTRKACEGQYLKGVAAEALAFDILKKIMQHPQLIDLTKQKIKEALEQGQPLLFKRVRELRAAIRRVKRDQEKWREAFYKEAVTTQQFKEENLRLVGVGEAAEKELQIAQAKLEGVDTFKDKLSQVFQLLQNFESIWGKMTPVQQRVVYRGIFNYLYIESARWSRQFKVLDFSLKEPFNSWYNGKVWEGPLVLREGDSVTVTHNKDKELCESFIFAPTAVR